MIFQSFTYFVLAVVGLTTQSVMAQTADSDCAPFRLDRAQADGSRGSLQDVPVLDQGAYGICFAETAAQMVDAYRFGVNKEVNLSRHVSALSAALDFKIDPSVDPLDTGSSCEVIDNIKSHGYHDAFKTSRCILAKESLATVEGLKGFYDAYWVQVDAKAQELKSVAPALTVDEEKKQLGDFKSSQGDLVVANLYTWLDAMHVMSYQKPPAKLIKDLLDYRTLRFIWAIESYQCYLEDAPVFTSLPACKTQYLLADTSRSRVQAIDRLLAGLAGQPLMIGYCPHVLDYGRNYPGVVTDSNGDRKCLPYTDPAGKTIEDTESHASLIIGRRLNSVTRTCEYLVRNSWGSRCTTRPYPITLPPALLNNPALAISYRNQVTPEPIYSPEWECDHGNIWVEEDALVKSVYRVQYLSEKPL